MTLQDFKAITQDTLQFKEDGRSFAVSGVQRATSFYREEGTGRTKSEPFDVVIRDHVFRILNYHGSFSQLTRSRYFIAEENENEFYYFASHKVPFYFVYYSCTLIQRELMAKYLENPFNAVVFAAYS